MQRWLIVTGCVSVLLLAQGQASLGAEATDESVRMAAVDDLDVIGDPDDLPGPPCGQDGICNLNACNNDPDCPSLPDRPAPDPLPRQWVQTSCGGELWVEAEDSDLGVGATTVRRKYPNFNDAQKAKNPSFFDAHPSGALATGHGELRGFGVTMVQGNWPTPIDTASGRLDDPVLLFFEKDGNDQDDWQIIGMGYAFAISRDNQSAPTSMPAIPASKWFIHEAGYHRTPGDGGFTCATNSDLKNSVFNAGKRVDAAGCNAITKSDLKTGAHNIDLGKHGRFWAAHVWLEPGTFRPALAESDPWCRQSSNALAVAACAFFARGSCF